MGDSITRGNASHEPGDNGTHRPHKLKIANRGNYPLELQRLLGANWDVRNFGHGGRSVVGAAAYDKTAEFDRACRFEPAVVLLMLGTNDAKVCPTPPTSEMPLPCKSHGGGSVWDADAFGPSLEALARRILRLPSRPSLILLAPPPVLPSAYHGSSISSEVLSTQVHPRIVAVARAIAATEPALPCLGWLDLSRGAWPGCPASVDTCRRYLLDDGVHTSAGGAVALASVVAARLQRCPAPETALPPHPWRRFMSATRRLRTNSPDLSRFLA